MQFLFPGVLVGIFAISIPIIIHLFNFRKYKTVYFSNTQYLKSIKQNSESRNKLKHLLILLARILTIIFLVMAFSQPFIPDQTKVDTAANKVIGIYVDNSFSMEAESKYGKLFDVAKKRAIEISKSFNSATKFIFLTNDKKVFHNHLVNRSQLQDFIEQAQTSPNFITLSEIVNHFNNNVAITLNNLNVPKKLFIISDFQTNIVDFHKVENDSLLSMVLLPLSTQNTSNVYIDSCWFETPYRKYQAEENLTIRLINTSDKSYQNIPVSFYINDSTRAFTSMNLEPNSSNVKSINYTNASKGIMNCRVEIEDYPIIHDNKYYFTYRIADEISILSINDNFESKNLDVLFGLDNYFDYAAYALKNVDYSQLTNFDVIILNEIDELTDVLINQTLKYVKDGGKLVIIPSQHSKTDSYNLFLSAINGNLITDKDTGEVFIDKVNFLSDIYAKSFENTTDEHIYPKIKNYFKNASFTRNNSISLIQSKNNFSLLTATNYFKGEVFMFYFPHLLNKNTFAIHPIYIPTFYNIALNSKSILPLSFVIGEDKSFELSLSSESIDNILSLQNTGSDFEFIPRIENTIPLKIYLQDQLTEAGNYNIKSEEKVVEAVSFNYDKKESDLKVLSIDEIRKESELNNLTNVQFIQNSNQTIEYDLERINQGTQLWYYFVLLALIFVLIEVLLVKFMK